MSGDILLIAIPLLALILAALSIAGLWYWWTSTREEPGGTDRLNALSELDRLTGASSPALAPSVGPPEQLEQSMAVPPVSSPMRPPPMQADSEVVEVMRVLRDLADGSLIVEIRGRRYRSLRDMDDPAIGRHFMGNAQALARFARLDKYDIPTTWEEPSALPVPPQPSAPPLAPSSEVLPTRPTPAAGLTLKRRGLFQRSKQEGDELAAPVLSMADEIEALLQRRLAEDASMASRSIHIRSAPDGGVRVEVDDHFYEGVGDVEDEAVRNFIQATIREWEARQ